MAAANHNPGLISTFLVVIAIALQYTGEYRQKMLEMHNANSTAIKEGIFSAIRSRLLDIVSFSSIEAVQTCVLLGTYYLYHGSPNLAWPVCGCGLRVAQALKLHRKLPTTEPTSLALQQEIETRKRCWWAIYEIETFCSISYGYPHGIVDADCNVELLDPLATYTCQSPASYNEMHQCPATLLSYKYLMSKLSVFLKEVLTDLYGIGLNKTGSWERQSFKLDSKRLLRKVAILDDRLDKWKAEIPDILCLSQVNRANYSSPEEMDRDIGASGPGFESHIYQLQALALAFAYENARILVHRPLMTYRTKLCQDPASGISPDTFKDTFQMSLQTCRNAAMSTSHIGTSPVFCLAAETYAAAFISIHTFTAGVMLCVLASIELFTPESQECKIGLRRILNMQGQLQSKSRSALSAQGLEILQRLTRLVMERELTEMLGSKTEASAQDKQPELQPSEDWNNSVEDQPDAQLGQGTEIFYGDSMPDIVENTDISQALFDLDQGMHHYSSEFSMLAHSFHSIIWS
ncbi:fungal-specific transcription factor domain-containing protein [Penicillium nucicola]|uniref:fungal-specific transcription factor domain-containing protein n=1 Tax=Penicillium nucicola TaxID=1850975 RepID=UPI00254525F4|nr:fungal-specific transcription factor domain-containing protein [Penicillium nucicola]KAJ5757152.1 fungal-specific transcription factor domain-containing protein [Penicillium nucicola]